MNKRERILMISTVVIIGGWIGLSFVDLEGSGPEVDGVAVEAERARFTDMAEEVSNAESIYRRYYDLVGPEAETGGEASADAIQRPDLDFQRAVTSLCDKAGFPRPNIRTIVEEIQDVDDYVLILVEVDLREGDLDRVSELMKSFDRNGLILTQLDLRASRDSPDLGAKITVGKLAERFTTGRRGRT
jgi:hypothetical protein